ncbi:MAG: hypothetical protein H0U71_07470 [Gammaproteobacteria bacterium]|nr:hypothetical protein [Gammaproteobacteria bacterium]
MFGNSESRALDPIIAEVVDLYVLYKEFFQAPFENPASFSRWLRKQQQATQDLLGGVGFIIRIRAELAPGRKYIHRPVPQSDYIKAISNYEDAIKKAVNHDDRTKLKRILGATHILNESDMITLQEMTSEKIIKIQKNSPITIAEYIYVNLYPINSAIASWYKNQGEKLKNVYTNRSFLSLNKKNQKHLTLLMQKLFATVDDSLPPLLFKEAITNIIKDPDLYEKLLDLKLRPEILEGVVEKSPPYSIPEEFSVREKRGVVKIETEQSMISYRVMGIVIMNLEQDASQLPPAEREYGAYIFEQLSNNLKDLNPYDALYAEKVQQELISTIDSIQQYCSSISNYVMPSLFRSLISNIWDVYPVRTTPTADLTKIILNKLESTFAKRQKNAPDIFDLWVLKLMLTLKTHELDTPDNVSNFKIQLTNLNKSIPDNLNFFGGKGQELKHVVQFCLEEINKIDLENKNQP